MIDLIRSINGPDFLVIYFIYSLVIIFLLKILSNSLNTTRRHALNPDLDSYTIAVLKSKGSIHTLAQTIIFKLYAEKYLEMEASKKGTTFRVSGNDIGSLNWIEKTVAEFFHAPKTYLSLLRNKKVAKDLKLFVENSKTHLTEIGFVKGKEQLKRERTFRSVAYLLLISLGITKLTLGLINNKPVVFLVLELILVSVVFFVANSVSSLTKEGKEFLTTKTTEYSWVRNSSTNSGFSSGMSDAVMGAALFGIASMYIYPEFGALSKTFGINSSSYASGTGCAPVYSDWNSGGSDNSGSSNNSGGSGCSSSGCGSSGCGSSGCGGGGCGGCGGN
ncbi:MAG TPA: TIGR04222 domain-containing membrane protein [Pseudobacteroides sp.]|uniref:TIGR04222 domain-containing membrane protein n=1 Tax=Pseudobacteroides sp. TaxID=1968840 RepID=UPI002F958C50